MTPLVRRPRTPEPRGHAVILHPLSPRFRRAPALSRSLATAAATLVFVAAGCRTVHEVRVDAINDPDVRAGESYRIVIRDTAGRNSGADNAKARAHVENALAARGLYKAPDTATPDMIIEMEYGLGPGHMIIEYEPRNMLGIDYWGKLPPKGGAVPKLVFDKFLKLTAREPTEAAADPGPELWSVNVVIEDPKRELEPYLPLLATACVDYIDADSGAEKIVKLKNRDEKAGTVPHTPPS